MKRLTDTEGDKFERMTAGFYENLRKSYLDLVATGMLGMVTIDGEGTIEDVHERILGVVKEKMKGIYK